VKEKEIEIIVPSEQKEPERIDSFLSRYLEFASRTQLKRLMEQGRVLVEGKAVKPSKKVRAGEKIKIIIPPPKPALPEPEPIPLKILYEDEHIIVVDKPAGLITHPLPSKLSGTLVNALLWHCSDLSGVGGVLKPGIVHRLDKLTSGVMVCAKNDRAHIGLAQQFKEHSISRAYQALVWGRIDKEQGKIESLIARNPRHRLKMTTKAEKGKLAITEWKVLERFKHFTLVECRLFTGRTHQIRVHFTEMGHPLVGDPLYGRGRALSEKLAPELRSRLRAMKRQTLHAYKLGFKHPISGKWLEFTSPLPEDFSSLLAVVRKYDQ